MLLIERSIRAFSLLLIQAWNLLLIELQLLQLLLVLILRKLRHSHPLHKYCPTEMLIFVLSKCMYTRIKVENHKIISLLLSRKKTSIELLLSGIFRLRTSFLLPQPVAFLQLEVFQLGQQYKGI